MSHFIEFINVTKKYQLDEIEICPINELSFTINKGDFITISGPSGSGKSTFLNLLGCIDQPTSGQIIIENDVITNINIEDLNQLRLEKIGFIFQSFNLVPVLTAFENVELPLLFSNLNLSSTDLKKRVEHLLDRVGLGDKMNSLPSKLSGGQRQRVAIARALVAEPTIIVADEPTANLDWKTADDIINLLLSLNKEKKMTVVIATHDIRVTSKSPIQVLMEDGKFIKNKLSV